MTTTALVTGATGQDGSYMIDLLCSKGYDVHALLRRTSTHHRTAQYLRARGVTVHIGDMTDRASLTRTIQACTPDEVYNYAAQSHVGTSFQQPDATWASTGRGAVDLFLSIHHHAPNARVYQASSSEMYGNAKPNGDRLTLNDAMNPVSPYGIAKLHAHQAAQRLRREGLHISCGIAFNHESERRHPTFVTRKITRAIARIEAGHQDHLHLGNLEAVRDWGYAPDYVAIAWRLLQHDTPTDTLICTGQGHSVQDFLDLVLDKSTVDPSVVHIDNSLKRPTDIDRLVGDPTDCLHAPKHDTAWVAQRMLDHDRAQVAPA